MTRLPFALAAALAAMAPELALAQKIGGGGAPDISVIRILAALSLCLAAAFAAALVLRRHGPKWPGLSQLFKASPISPRIMVIESRRVSPHAEVSLVQCDGVDYLILSGPAQAQLLSQRPIALE